MQDYQKQIVILNINIVLFILYIILYNIFNLKK